MLNSSYDGNWHTRYARPRVTPQHTTLDSTQKHTRVRFGIQTSRHAWAMAMSMLSIIMTAMP